MIQPSSPGAVGTRPRPASAGRLHPRYERLALLGLAVVSLGLKLRPIFSRSSPILLPDEFIYLAKAMNFHRFGSFHAPEGVIDAANLTPPLYSLVLAPIVALGADATSTYRLALALNCFLLTSILYPVFHLLRRNHPASVALPGAALAVLWPVPSLYGSTVLSEALFVPLFCWAVYCYVRAYDSGRWQDLAWFGGLVVLLAATRWVGVGMVGVAALVSVLSFPRGQWVRLASALELRRRLPLLLLGAPAFALWAYLMAAAGRDGSFLPAVRHASAARQIQGAVGQLDAHEGLLDYLGIWAAQLTYLNLATGGALAVLLGVFVVVWIGRRPLGDLAAKGGERAHGLLGPVAFATVSGLAVLFPTTVVIWRAAQVQDKTRWDMYGRYSDMVVPVLLVLALDLAFRLPERLRPLYSRVVVVAGALVLLGSFTIPDPIEGIHALNHGAAWFEGLRHDQGVPGLPLLAVSLVPALFCFKPGLSRRARLVAVLSLALLPSYGFVAAREDIAAYDAAEAARIARLAALVGNDAALYYVPGEVSNELRAQAWLIRRRPGEVYDGGEVAAGDHFVLFREHLWEGADFAARQRATAYDLVSEIHQATVVGQKVADTPWGLAVVPVNVALRRIFHGGVLSLPEAQLLYELELPDEAAELRVGIGFHPVARDWGSDGVRMQVRVRGMKETVLLDRLVLPSDGFLWQELSLDAYRGQSVVLVLATSNDVSMHGVGDWPVWLDPRIVVREVEPRDG